MHHLVFDKNAPHHLYKKSGHLVRTPISETFTLNPITQMRFDVGNDYKQVIPTRDFYTTTGSGNYAIIAGHSMRKCYLGREIPSHDSSGWAQIWRSNGTFSSIADPGYIFYNGNYSPAWGMMGGASFLSLPAYKFAIPSSITTANDWQVTSLKINMATHGVVITSGNAATKKTNSGQYPVFAMDANTTLLPSNSSWRVDGSMNIGIFSEAQLTAVAPMNLFNQCQQTATIPNVRTDACENQGEANGYPYWITWPSGTVTYNDGHVINAPSHPYLFQVTANSTMCSAVASLISNGSFYIPLIVPVSDSGSGGSTVTNNDYPNYYISSASGGVTNWWLCERHQIKSIEITFTIE